jgi:uncharacterized protein YdcH (DUF465 family)
VLLFNRAVINSRRSSKDADSKSQLLTGHDEFQRLVQEHSQYSQRLESLTQKRYLTDDEKLEEVRLKKLKLRLKDQMLNAGAAGAAAVCLDSPA